MLVLHCMIVVTMGTCGLSFASSQSSRTGSGFALHDVITLAREWIRRRPVEAALQKEPGERI